MDFIVSIFNLFLYQPLFNVLIFLYNYIPGSDFGIAVVILTVISRLAVYPLSAQAIRVQRKLSEIQPRIKEIQEKIKDKAEQGTAIMALYKEAGVNPFAGFLLPFLIQLPIIIALYQVFRKGFEEEQLSFLYGFVSHPGVVDPSFLGLVDLSQASLVLAVVAGALQFFQIRQSMSARPDQKTKKGDMGAMIQKQMMFVFPVIAVLILSQLPSALGVYWIVGSIVAIVQHWHVTKSLPKSKTPTPTASTGAVGELVPHI